MNQAADQGYSLLDAGTLGSSAPEIVERLVALGQKAGASDMHFQMNGDCAEIAFRLDGVIRRVVRLSVEISRLCFGRIKYLAKLKTYQDSLPQEGRIAAGDIGTCADIRVSTYPTVVGEKIVLRLFPSAVVKSLDDLQFPATARQALQRYLLGNTGMLLLTGPAGSGKTTTIYACLQFLAGQGRHIITVEDPVEQVLPSVMQTEVNEEQGLTYARAAKHLLRQDPEILVIGEVRDAETAHVAVQATLTGHLVIATLHAGSCKKVIERMALMSGDTYSVVSSLELAINQRLIRAVCRTCRGRGCEDCLQSGYHGRFPVVEWVALDDAIRQAILSRGPDSVTVPEDLRTEGRRLVETGLTDETEYTRVFGP